MDRSNPAWTVSSKEDGDSLRSFLKQQLRRSNREVAKLIDGGKVEVNGKREQFGSKKLKQGEMVHLLGLPPSNQSVPAQPKLDIIHEDEMLLVINKQAGFPSQKTRDPKRITLEGLVHSSFEKKNQSHPILAHRLDLETSGLLLFAKTETFGAKLMDAFRHRKIHKTYLAICEGAPRKQTGTWTHHLGPGGQRGGKTFHTILRSGGQKAVTDFRILASKKGHSLWELKPQTGRTHQLRVQCSKARHPIVGDHFYGASSTRGRHLLHAAQISLPFGLGEFSEFSAPLPPDFKSKLKELGIESPHGK